MSLEEIIQGSDVIIVGEVEDVQAFEGRKTKFIFSQAKIKVHEVLKGNKSLKTVDVEFPGGLYKGGMFMVNGDKHLHKGEKVVLCLVFYESEIFEGRAFRMKGGNRGTFWVDKDSTARSSNYIMQLDKLIEKIRSME